MIAISPNTIKQNELQIKVAKNTPTGQSEILAPGDIGTSGVEGDIIKKQKGLRYNFFKKKRRSKHVN